MDEIWDNNDKWGTIYKMYEQVYSNDGSCIGFKDAYQTSIADRLLRQLVDDDDDDDDDNYKGSKPMKKCEVCLPDGNGKAQIGVGCVFISPSTTGFMLWSNPEGTVELHAFSTIEGVLEYMQENKLLDMTQNAIAENI